VAILLLARHAVSMLFACRPYQTTDLPAIYRICLLTGDAGADATPLYIDPELLGHFYAAPYVVLEPELCFVLTADGMPAGYVLGTRDEVVFAERAERDWFPTLRARLPHPAGTDSSHDATLLRLIHSGFSPDSAFLEYRAHLHINLLPVAQGQGNGRQLLNLFVAAIRAYGVTGVKLGVSHRNERAIVFYERCGFRLLADHSSWRSYGMKLER
jgi:ribosomal protein S18 acetylase RimI-like enzyme